MEPKAYFYKVPLQEVDFTQKIRLSSLISYLLNTSGKNADDNGFGIKQLAKNNHTWVLSRFALEVEKMPKYDDDFSIETWVEDFGRVFTTRNFAVKNAENQVVASGTSSWAMIDFTSRTVVNLQDLYSNMAEFVVPIAPGCKRVGKLSSPKNPESFEYEVKYSDIDFNNHANSVCYIDWLLNLIPNAKDFFSKNEIKRFEINYLNEARFGEKLTLLREMSDNKAHFEIKRQDDIICKMFISFE